MHVGLHICFMGESVSAPEITTTPARVADYTKIECGQSGDDLVLILALSPHCKVACQSLASEGAECWRQALIG